MRERYRTFKARGRRGGCGGRCAYGDARCEITCEINRFTIHAVFAKSYPEAAEKVEAIKLEPKEYVMGCKDGTIDPNAWIEASVARL